MPSYTKQIGVKEMNGKNQAIDNIIKFLKSDDKGVLLTGTNQFRKHYLVMSLLDKYYKNANVLFRINGMSNIIIDSFTPLSKQPKAGEVVRLGNNNYEFDAFTSRSTWTKTNREFDFAIVYPIDAMCRKHNVEPIDEIYRFKRINKIFLCSWIDRVEYDYSILSDYYQSHIIYDIEKEDSE
jgi:hypothetical protein